MRKSILITVCGAACAIAQAAPFSADTVSQQAPSSTYNRYLELADSARYHIGKEQWSEAARCTRDALRLEPANPSNPMLFSNLGLASG
ncbi:MAG: hypothetical protein K2L00_08685, partial [Muribaculaceae bacterium]|nr:hypothetical protein [Muribaculaceae bacterium]